MKHLTYVHFSMLVFQLIFCLNSFGQTLYVATNGDNTDGLTWATAYTTIQAAVNAAGDNDTVIVGSSGTGHGDGVYIENIDISTPLTLESESGYETTTIQAADLNDHAVYVIGTHDVTVRGFSVFGATKANPVYAAGIYVRDSSYCTVENNRCGWNDGVSHQNYKGIRLDISDHCLITNNYVGYNIYSGIYMGYWATTPYRSQYNTISYNTCDQPSNSILAQGLSTYNNIIYNTCINGAAISMSNCDFNYLAFNQCPASSSGFNLSMCNDNVIANNFIANSNGYGIDISGSGGGYYNTIANNTFSDCKYDAIDLSYVSSNIVAGNTFPGSSRYSVNLGQSSYARMFLNTYGDSTIYGTTWYPATDCTGNTSTAMTYFIPSSGSSHQHSIGNYYPYRTTTDSNGDGIDDTAYSSSFAPDAAPLVNTPNQYNLQAWFIHDSGTMLMDFDKSPKIVDITASNSAVWHSKLPAPADANYPAAPWSGQLRFTTAISEADITIDIGYADTDGSSFVASGASGQPDTSTAITTYTTSAQAFTVPQGKTLAMRISNANVVDSAEIITGGAWSYLTAPAGSTIAWSDTIAGDIVEPEGVDLVDFAYLAARWARSDCASTGDCEGADLDGLGTVDIEDLEILTANWLVGK